ncbi:helix-turn-helix domain-containing protein [Actinocatenispora rupis]|uniref:HTH cro/C1-type domain-containing protein n=1 Tax=Actinocatenispora rupis TaxID=519421 RepID=A0A8J3NF94_9ACTN|nr:helix-turn-helix transcriptional regulator [Actinocatenispora rupis]GID14660.1 hypothetical protein Aru02nite_55490 [Actinocatenispora rupis]
METEDVVVALGRRLRARRTVRQDTLASTAERAGLSVPYIANLENGRGNPTLAALDRLAAALGARLVVDLADADDQRDGPTDANPPPSLIRFAKSAPFHAAVRRIADATHHPHPVVRERLLAAMTRLGSLAPDGRATDLDWHRVLDAATLIATNG